MKFMDILDMKEDKMFKVTFEDNTEYIYRIHNNCLEYYIDNKWVEDVYTLFNAFLYSKNIEYVWHPIERDLVYYIDFNAIDGVNHCTYIASNMKMIDILYELGLVFSSEKEAYDKLREIVKDK